MPLLYLDQVQFSRSRFFGGGGWGFRSNGAPRARNGRKNRHSSMYPRCLGVTQSYSVILSPTQSYSIVFSHTQSHRVCERIARRSAHDEPSIFDEQAEYFNTHRWRDHQVLADEQSREAGEQAVTRIQAISRGKRARNKNKAGARGSRTRASDRNATTTTDRRQSNAAFDCEGQPNEGDRRHRGGFDNSDEPEHHRGLVERGEGTRRVAPPRDAAAAMGGAAAASEGVVIDRRAAKLIASLVDERVMVRHGA